MSQIDSSQMHSSLAPEGSYAFIGLGALGFHLASRLVLGGFELYVHDLSEDLFARLQSHLREQFSSGLALSPRARLSNLHWSANASEAVSLSGSLITCLPSPAASNAVIREVIGSADFRRPSGAVSSGSSTAPASTEPASSPAEPASASRRAEPASSPAEPASASRRAESSEPASAEPATSASSASDFLWIEMSTNDPVALRELSSFAFEHGIASLAVPVTGGVHRAAAGEITLLIGGERCYWQAHRLAFAAMGGEQIYVGTIEQAAELKAITNMLAFIHLSATGEALALAQASGIDLARAFRAIKHSSGNSFVFETEGQVILNGSYHIDFTLDLARKDMGFVLAQASRHEIPLALASLVAAQFEEARSRYGGDGQSSQLVKLLEERIGREFRAAGFPAVLPAS